MKKVIFVCLGNICRSPVAQGVFQSIVDANKATDRYVVDSAGTGAYHVGEQPDSRMCQTSKGHGITLDHKAQQLQPHHLSFFDHIFAMDDQNLEDIKRLAWDEHGDKIKLFREFDPVGGGDVPDPYYGGPEGFEEVYGIVERTCQVLFESMESGQL